MYKITRETNIVDRDEFEVGSYYKCVNPDSTGDGEVGEIYRLKKLSTGNMVGHFSHHSLETPATISIISLLTAQFELVQVVKPVKKENLAENVVMITRDECERETHFDEKPKEKKPVSFLYNDRQREEAERIHKARNRWRF